VACPRLPAPSHGAALHLDRLGDRLAGASIPWGASALFTCGEGRRLVGTEVAECLDTGAWSHEPPQCQSRALPAWQ
jgi:hypothetical protein